MEFLKRMFPKKQAASKVEQYKQRMTEDIIAPMLEFMKECGADCEFSAKDVERCRALLNGYLEALAALTNPTDEAILAQVEKVVLALNELNEATDCALIETSERESICILIQDAAVECGLQADVDDVTEEWREW